MKAALLALALAGGCATVQPVSRIREISAGPCRVLSWPVNGVLASTFGSRWGRPHQGIDIATPDGTPVRVACDGVVTYAGDRLRGYGELVIVQHAGDLTTVYAHNEQLLVHEGDPVRRGQVIARSGHSGHATGPHVHFEVRRDAIPCDPLAFLPPRVQTQARIAKRTRRRFRR